MYVEASNLGHHPTVRQVHRHACRLDSVLQLLVPGGGQQKRLRPERGGDQPGDDQFTFRDEEVEGVRRVSAVAKTQVVGNARVVGGFDFDRHGADSTGADDRRGLRTDVRYAKMAR